MTTYRITLKDTSTEDIGGADAYQQEGQMTTFFQHGAGRQVIDTWSTRLASFRTTEILAIRRVEAAAELSPAHAGPHASAASPTDLRHPELRSA